MRTKIWLFRKSIVDLERDDYGVYELLDNDDKIIYMGCGKIRCSLLKHFADGKNPIDDAQSFSVEYTWSEEKAIKRFHEEISKYYKQNGKYPKFNKPPI